MAIIFEAFFFRTSWDTCLTGNGPNLHFNANIFSRQSRIVLQCTLRSLLNHGLYRFPHPSGTTTDDPFGSTSGVIWLLLTSPSYKHLHFSPQLYCGILDHFSHGIDISCLMRTRKKDLIESLVNIKDSGNLAFLLVGSQQANLTGPPSLSEVA